MGVKLLNIGFGSLVAANRILAVVSPESAPTKLLVQDSRERGSAIDATFGRRTKAVLVMDTDHVVLSALTPQVLAQRLGGGEDGSSEEELL